MDLADVLDRIGIMPGYMSGQSFPKLDVEGSEPSRGVYIGSIDRKPSSILTGRPLETGLSRRRPPAMGWHGSGSGVVWGG